MKTICTACERFPDDCRLRFKCVDCGEVLGVCGHRVGGFTGYEDVCDFCHMARAGFEVYKLGGSRYATRPRRARMKGNRHTMKGEM